MDAIDLGPALDAATPTGGAMPSPAPSRPAGRLAASMANIRRNRSWLGPVALGVVAAVASAILWTAIYQATPCGAGTIWFGFLALLGFGAVAFVGVWLAVDSQQVARRRRGKALLLGGVAGAVVFLLLTATLPWVLPAC